MEPRVFQLQCGIAWASNGVGEYSEWPNCTGALPRDSGNVAVLPRVPNSAAALRGVSDAADPPSSWSAGIWNFMHAHNAEGGKFHGNAAWR